jgi:hypothetical protein
VSPPAGTNTNWLERCDAAADCEGAGDCLCGVCTISCTSNAQCSAVGQDVRCTAADEASCGAGAPDSICLGEPSSRADASTSNGDPALTLMRVGTEVKITERYRSCELDDDCILVGTSCNACCERDAISALDLDAYTTNRELACSDYRGPECDCMAADVVPRCVDGLCAALTPDPVRDCFSPSQNVQRAQFSDALGCECEQVGLEVCVGLLSIGVRQPLLCAKGANGTRWTRVDGGACDIDEPDCSLEQQRADADACLSEYASCFERVQGGFCGSGCVEPFTCNEDDCQYRALDPAECNDLRVWEGRCGDVRYRAQSTGLQMVTQYWNADTAQLLAMRETTDSTLTPCGGEVLSGDLAVVKNCELVLDATTEVCSR